jgi:hypothetical protein
MNLREALLLKDAEFQLSNGITITLRRPSALDLVEVIEVAKEKPNEVPFILVHKHLLENGKPFFNNADEVKNADGKLVNEIFAKIEELYGEGRS